MNLPDDIENVSDEKIEEILTAVLGNSDITDDYLDQEDKMSRGLDSKWRYVEGEWRDTSQISIQEEHKGWVSESGARFKAVPVVKNILPPNIYTFVSNDHGHFFEKQPFLTDEPILLPGLPCEYILNRIKTFWDAEKEYKKYNLVHKTGIMMYGAPGCGKTSIIRLLCNRLLELGGVIFSIDDFRKAAIFVSEFRRTEPNRPILTIMEDIEGLFEGTEGADQIKAALSFLDGQDQTGNIVHVASTNMPERIADRFIKRPGRFDLVIGIHEPISETREAYLKHVCRGQIPEDKLKELVEKTKGLGLAYLRELAASYICLGVPLDETLSRLQKNHKTKVFENKNTAMGFDTEAGFTLGYSESKEKKTKKDGE